LQRQAPLSDLIDRRQIDEQVAIELGGVVLRNELLADKPQAAGKRKPVAEILAQPEAGQVIGREGRFVARAIEDDELWGNTGTNTVSEKRVNSESVYP